MNARQIRTHLTWNQQNQKGNMTVAELCQTWNCWKNSHFVILFHPKTRKIPDAMDYWIFVLTQTDSLAPAFTLNSQKVLLSGIHRWNTRIHRPLYPRHKPKWIGVTRCVLWVEKEKARKTLYTLCVSLSSHVARAIRLSIIQSVLLRSLPFSPKNVKQGL